VLKARASNFALLHRPAVDAHKIEVLLGEVAEVDMIADLPVDDGHESPGRLLALIPYRQAAERGFACRNDGSPLLTLRARESGEVAVADAVERLPDAPVEVLAARFDVEDERYADIVRTVVREEIGQGAGANFVIKRALRGHLGGSPLVAALAAFRRLLLSEQGAYWTFLVRVAGRILVGASPERHVHMSDGVVSMNPISGTYRYGDSGPTAAGALEFLRDQKEIDELFMVVDEELKMMARVCDDPASVAGPYLKEMARLAHTEYVLEGHSRLDVRAVLRETMFAPTVTGSPVQNAFRAIARHEPEGRGYYSGVLALITHRGHAADHSRSLDSVILIRSAQIDPTGGFEIGVGATLVRHSQPEAEVAETHAKVAALLDAITGHGGAGTTGERVGAATVTSSRLADDPRIRGALTSRNRALAPYWLRSLKGADRDVAAPTRGALVRLRPRILVIDAEDAFTGMLAQQIRSLGAEVVVTLHDDSPAPSAYDLTIVGPGPGDPRRYDDPKIATLRAIVRRLLADHRPFIAVCLGHQVLADILGLRLIRKAVPGQGRQRRIDLFGQDRRVGFYNSFAAHTTQRVHRLGPHGTVEASFDADTGEVHALRGARFRSVQFHPESVLSVDGMEILAEALDALLSVGPVPARPLSQPTDAVELQCPG
jgi:phenazine biosynthesis protein phzE